MKEIPLTRGQVALVDDEYFEWLSQWKWYARWHAEGQSYRVARTYRDPETGQHGTRAMHAEILGTVAGEIGDHINHDALDNRRANLRKCDQCQNSWNARKMQDSRAPYKGVTLHGVTLSGARYQNPRWLARICVRGKRIHLGFFRDPIEAARAYDRAAQQYFGEFACINGV